MLANNFSKKLKSCIQGKSTNKLYIVRHISKFLSRFSTMGALCSCFAVSHDDDNTDEYEYEVDDIGHADDQFFTNDFRNNFNSKVCNKISIRLISFVYTLYAKWYTCNFLIEREKKFSLFLRFMDPIEFSDIFYLHLFLSRIFCKTFRF